MREPMRIDSETAEAILPPHVPHPEFIVMLTDGDGDPRVGWGTLNVPRRWLARNYPRAWAAYVLGGGVFTLKEEEIACKPG